MRQDWLVRPVRRKDLLLAKLLFVVVMVHGPILLADTLQALANGFPLGQSLASAATRGLLLLGYLSLPVEEYFDTAAWEEGWIPRYNIAPTQSIPVIRQHPKQRVRQLSLMRWGLIPHWAKSPSVAANTINAKSETDKKTGNSKQPYCFEVDAGQLFAFAGLWDGWKDPNGHWVKTCSILTTTPNAVTSTVHDRMPVILDPGSYDLWLDPGMQDVPATCELLKPYDPGKMRCYPVSNRVNHAGNDDEVCSRPVVLADTQNRLFA